MEGICDRDNRLVASHVQCVRSRLEFVWESNITNVGRMGGQDGLQEKRPHEIFRRLAAALGDFFSWIDGG